MIPFNHNLLSLLNKKAGIEAVLHETERQTADLQDTLLEQEKSINELADEIKKKSKVFLLGMGASHFINHMFAVQLRSLGYWAIAVPASEFYYDSFDVSDTQVILTSQSGESIETVKCLEKVKLLNPFCVTLEPNSTLGTQCRSIIASGGAEKAFAGTRSVTLTIGIFSFVYDILSGTKGKTLNNITPVEKSDILQKAINSVSHKRELIITGRGIYFGLAELMRLGCEELSGISSICYEGGQLRHGPLEVFDFNATLVVFRQSGMQGQLATSFEEISKKSGVKLIVFDSSGMRELSQSITIPFKPGNSLSSALNILPSIQAFMMSYACKRNPQAGIPFYSSKVTSTE